MPAKHPAKEKILEMNQFERDLYIDKLQSSFKVKNPKFKDDGIFLSWDEIIKMSNDADIHFAPHTISHPSLASIGIKKAEEEIIKSKNIVEKNN